MGSYVCSMSSQGVGIMDEETDKENSQGLLGQGNGKQNRNPGSKTPNSVPFHDLLLLHPLGFQQTPSDPLKSLKSPQIGGPHMIVRRWTPGWV